MDITEYFRVVSLADHVMHVEMSGFWSDQVVRKVGRTYLTQFITAVNQISAEGPFVRLADLTRLAVVSREGRSLIGHAMRYANEHGMYKVVEVIPGAIANLSIREAAETSGSNDLRIVVKTLDEAMPIVERLVQDLPSVRPTSLLAHAGVDTQ